jgi:hypothetical protein
LWIKSTIESSWLTNYFVLGVIEHNLRTILSILQNLCSMKSVEVGKQTL